MEFPIAQEWLDLLACPRCKGDLKPVKKPLGLACERCDLFYKIQEGIPVMLVEEAEKYSEVARDESSH